MAASRFFVRAWIAIFSIAILATPVGAHLHLCFDGGEAPSSIHMTDDGVHDGEQASQPGHHDVDVNLDSSALAKKFEGPKKLPPLAVVFVLFRVSVQNVAAVPRDDTSHLIPDSDYRMLPPPRGPPV